MTNPNITLNINLGTYTIDDSSKYGYTATIVSNNEQIDFSVMSHTEICTYLGQFISDDNLGEIKLVNLGGNITLTLQSGTKNNSICDSETQCISKTKSMVIFECQNWTYGEVNNRSLTYTGTYIIQSRQINTLGFVTANNLNMYPTEGEYNDYWYELIQ